MGELSSALKSRQPRDHRLAGCPPAALSGLLARIVDATISGKIAKDVFEAIVGRRPRARDDNHRESGALKQNHRLSGAIEGVIDAVIAANPKQTRRTTRAGNDKALSASLPARVMKGPPRARRIRPQLNELVEGQAGWFSLMRGSSQDA